MKKANLQKRSCFSLVTTICLMGSFAFANPIMSENMKDKLKSSIEGGSQYLQEEIDRLGDNLGEIQQYLETYPWKGLIRDEVSAGHETLSHLRLNGHKRVAVVRPCEEVEGELDCYLDPKGVASLKIYRVVLGYKGHGPQTVVASSFGLTAGPTHQKFTLSAPRTPGLYEIRFRNADNFLESRAMDAWYDEEGCEPDSSTTIGLLYVKS